MSLEKKALEGMLLAGSFVMLCVAADNGGQKLVVETVQAAVVTIHTDNLKNVTQSGAKTAGISAFLEQTEEETQAPKVQQTVQDIVASAEDAEYTEEEDVWQERLMADVDDFLYVRSSGDADAEIVGKLYKGDVAQVIEAGDTWTHVTSGDVDGFVKNEYCIIGRDAMNYANENFEKTAEIQANGLRIRSDADEDSSVLTIASIGTTLTIDTSVETSDEWIAVKYDGSNIGFVSAEYVETDVALGEAITIEEERAIAEAAAAVRAEQAAKQAAEAANTVKTVQKEAVSASFDDITLLAALIQCEAGNEPYEGQVAVGAVVMNRVRSGSYANNLYDVIYQPYQFTPAGRGDVSAVAARGPKASCVQAAQEALNGADNTGGATCFRRVSSGMEGYVIGNHVFF